MQESQFRLFLQSLQNLQSKNNNLNVQNYLLTGQGKNVFPCRFVNSQRNFKVISLCTAVSNRQVVALVQTIFNSPAVSAIPRKPISHGRNLP